MAKANKQNSPYSELSRKLKGSDYGSAIDTLQTDLELLEASGAEMEALLIYMVNRCYRQRSFNVDITLMALGLLDGYNNRLDRLEPIEERDLYSERRERFLQNTNYIATKYGNLAKTFKEAEQTLVKNQKSGEEFPLIERIRKTLDRSTTNLLIAVLKKLYDEKASVNVYLEKAKKDFQKRVDEKELGNIDWSEDHIFPQLLPSLKYYGRPPEEASLSQPCDTVKNLNFIDKKNPVEVARVIALTPTGPVESDSESPAEQVQEPALESPPGLPMKPVQELGSEPFSEYVREQPVDVVSELAPVSTTEPTSDSVEEPTQGLPPEPTQEPLNPNAKKDKPNKRIAIVAMMMLLLVVFAVVLFMIHAKDKDLINPVKADEGGGIVNPNEASIEANTSMTVHSSSGATIDVNFTGIDNRPLAKIK